MSHHVLILGVKGRFGRAAAKAFIAAGWRVRGFARNWPKGTIGAGVERIEGDAFDLEALIAAGDGCDVIVNALNPPYERWKQDLPGLTHSVIEAAKVTKATVMVPGNLYNYGKEMPSILTEKTPHLPTAQKGRMRCAMEATYARAGDDGVQTIILRAGDFIERQQTGNWFDTYIAAKVGQGKATYPGPLDRVHAWAYLPDMARAMVGLAEARTSLSMFEEFGFEGLNLTGRELITAMEETSGRSLKVRSMPWGTLRFLGEIAPKIREVVEMKYLWDVPHAIDGSKFARALPEFEATPLSSIFADALASPRPSAKKFPGPLPRVLGIFLKPLQGFYGE